MIKTLTNIIIYLFFPSIFVSLFTTNFNSIKSIILLTISYILLIIYFYIKYKKELTNYYKKFKKKHIKTIILYWLIGFILMIISNYIINFLIIPNGISNNESSNIELLLNYKYIYPISICILIPILEEIIFRLELKKIYKNKYIFLLLSSIIFTIPHLIANTKLIELLYFIPYFILGYTLSLIYYKTNNIYSNILAHMIHNTLIVFYYLIIL